MFLKMLISVTDLLFSSGPLDVLDHSSDNFSFGGKAGIDATIKMEEEKAGGSLSKSSVPVSFTAEFSCTATSNGF